MEQVSQGKVHAGRVVLPAELRKELGIKDGDNVIFSRTEHGIEIQTMSEVVRQVQEYCSSFITPGVSLVDELIEERRQEALREEEESRE
jgi:AbrB family transcriptional regulator, stage V sporulation protein T